MPPCDSKNRLFDTNILEIYILGYTSRFMANFVFNFSKISHHGNKSWLDGKSLNSSIYLYDPVNVVFDAIS